jgi:hypothetical protein
MRRRGVHVEGEVLLEDAVLLVDEVDPDGGLILVREFAWWGGGGKAGSA